MATIIKTDSAKLVLADTEEHELIPAPPEGQRHIITHVEYQNNDSINHAPKIRIRDDSDRALRENPASDGETEYTPLLPTGRAVDSNGGVLEWTPPIYTLKNIEDAIESLVVQDLTVPTNSDNPPVIWCQWLVEI